MSDQIIIIHEPVEIVTVTDDQNNEIVQVVNEEIVENVLVTEQGMPGPPASDSLVFGEVPSGDLDGSNATFQTALPFVPEQVGVYINGLRQKIIQDYLTEGQQTISMVVSPLPTDQISVDYARE